MSVISLVIAPQLALQIDGETGMIKDWETTGVIIGAVILVLLIVFTYWWQSQINKFYQDKEQDMIKRQKANAAKVEAAAKAAASEEDGEEQADADADAGEIEMVENPAKEGEEAPDEEKATE